MRQMTPPRGAWADGGVEPSNPDAVLGPSKHQPFRYELSGMTVPVHDATIRDDGMVTTGGPGASSMLTVMRIFCCGE